MSKRTFWDEPRASVLRCFECGDKVPNHDELGHGSQCARCGADLHCCKNCAFFDTSAEKECRKPIPERIAKKSAANRCELFRPALAVDLRGGTEGVADKNAEARRAWDELFKD